MELARQHRLNHDIFINRSIGCIVAVFSELPSVVTQLTHDPCWYCSNKAGATVTECVHFADLEHFPRELESTLA
jgi:hypothetical protein